MTTFSSPGKYPNSPRVSKQAESKNIIGSTNPTDVRGIINPNQNPDFSFSFSNLSTDTPTFATLLTDPGFVCDLIDRANNLDTTPLCSGSETLMIEPGPRGGFSLTCGCVDPSGSELFAPPTDQDLSGLLNLFVIEDCLRKKANDKFNECLNDSNISGRINDLLSEIPEEYQDVVSVLLEECQDLVNSDIDFGSRASSISSNLDSLAAAMLSLGVDVTDIINGIISDIADCQNQIANDPSVNNIPSDDTILAILYLISRLPRLECKNGKILGENCECVCPSGFLECSNGECIACSGDSSLTEKSTANPDGSFSTSCSCECAEGYTKYNIPTNEGPRPDGATQTPCVKECPEGYVFKEAASLSLARQDCEWVVETEDSFRCYACFCKGQTDDGTTLISQDSCPQTNAEPNPANNCECDCPEGYEKIYHPDIAGGLKTEDQVPNGEDFICILPCPSGTKFNWSSLTCVCSESDYSALCGPSGTDICPGTSAMNPDTCECSGVEFCEGGRYRENQGTVCEPNWVCVCPSGTNYDSIIEECVCPSGATVTSSGPPGGSQDCECPPGQIVTGDRESGYYCASGSYSYTSNILNQELSTLGYQYHYNVELL